MTNQQPKPAGPDKEKRDRLSKALRENLLRRKAWQRAQEEKKQEKK